VQAACAPTITPRVRLLSCALVVREEFACSADCGETPSERRAGNIPNRIAAATDKPALKRSTGRLICTSSRRGMLTGANAIKGARQ
jgi:hypothetical protein